MQNFTFLFKRRWPLLLFLQLLFSISVFAQQKTITGKVTGASGEALPGVTVNLKGTQSGTQTDADGKYKLTVNENKGTLVFSFIGYVTKEEVIDGRAKIDVQLTSDSKSLNEVVVLGYGTSSKKDVTGSVVSVKTSELPQVAQTSINNLLQGQAAGLTLDTRSAQPGGGLTVTIRGAISPHGANTPLYIIDGVPITNNNSATPSINDKDLGFYGGVDQDPLSSINPSDIENVTVLKDASATAIYGAAAANGVILVTTKRGKKGNAIVSYSGSYTVQKPKSYFNLLDATGFETQQVRLAHDKYLFDNGLAPYGTNDPATAPAFSPLFTPDQIASAGKGTDWLGSIIRNGSVDEHNISVSGGTDKTKIFSSFNYYDNKAILENSNFKRYSGRVNIDQQLGERVKFSLNLTFSQINSNNASTGSNSGGAEKYNQLQAAYSFAPNLGVYNADGSYTKSYDNIITNPAAFLIIQNNTNTNRFMASPNIEVKITDDLKWNTVVGIDKQTSELQFFLPVKAQNYQLPTGMAQLTNNHIQNYSAESFFTYNKRINSDNNFSVVGGVGYYKSSNEGYGLEAVGFPTDALGFYNVGLASDKDKSFAFSNRDRDLIKVSGYFRANYSYKNKYLLTITGREDGESYFATNKQFGFFPGASLGWRINQEDFLKNSKVISSLKLRAGYGTSGNSPLLGSGALPLYGSAGPVFVIGSTYYPGIGITQIANDNLKWETDKTINFGLDYGFFNDRLTGSLDVFQKTASGLIDYDPLPVNNEVGQVVTNIGSTRSRGIEFSILSQNVRSQNFSWTTNFNISAYKNFWVSRNPETPLASYIGYKDNIREVYGWRTAGIIHNKGEIPAYMPNANLGNIIYKDINGDGKLDVNDVVKLGNPDPKFSLGFGNTFTYKNFDLYVFMYGSFGMYEVNNYGAFYDPTVINESTRPHNTLAGAANIFSADNPSGIYPGYAANAYTGNNPSQTNNFYGQNVNFLRLKNITLGYKLPLHDKFIKTLRFFADAQNLAIITNYKGYDPEYTETNPYPLATSITFGVNATF
jgi:TonB-linked SusC/RagA family outer membrane protein